MIINQVVAGGGGGIDTNDATAYPEHILEGYTAYARGAKITGTLEEPSFERRLLLHCESLVDSGPFGIPLAGTAVISSDRSKFGNNSIYFNGSTYLDINKLGVIAFDTELFTLDMWINFTAYSSANRYCLIGKYSADNTYWYLEILNGRINMDFAYLGTSRGSYATAVQSFTSNVWYHICLQRVSLDAGYDCMRIYLNGTRLTHDASWAYNVQFPAGVFLPYSLALPGMTLGRFSPSSRFFSGYIDEVHLNIGSNTFDIDGFTPPTAPY